MPTKDAFTKHQNPAPWKKAAETKTETRPKHPTRMRKDVFTLHHHTKGSASGDRAVLAEKTGLSSVMVRTLTNGARYSLHGWSLDPGVVPLKPGQKRPKDK